MGSSCQLITGNTDPDLQASYEKLREQMEQLARDLETQKRVRTELEANLQQIQTQQATKDTVSTALATGS